MYDISVVVPVYKNENTIQNLTTEVLQCFKGQKLTVELVFINDASPDNSINILKNISKEHPEVNYYSMEYNQGQHAAILQGLKLAKGDKIVVMDADLQDSPSMIIPLANSLEGNNDSVFILREGMYQPLSRMITSWFFKGFIQIITGLPKKTGTFFIIKSELRAKLLAIKCSYPFMTIMVAHSSENIGFLRAPRNHNAGISAYSFKKRLIHAYKATVCAIQCRYFN